jgi:hypothetical protein
MLKRNLAALALLLAMGLVAYGFVRVGLNNRAGTQTVNERVDSIYRSADQEIARIQEHAKQTTERVTVIRERVRAEVGELDMDGLAEAALEEVRIYHETYGN